MEQTPDDLLNNWIKTAKFQYQGIDNHAAM